MSVGRHHEQFHGVLTSSISVIGDRFYVMSRSAKNSNWVRLKVIKQVK